jgi:hypothetical protein
MVREDDELLGEIKDKPSHRELFGSEKAGADLMLLSSSKES